MKRMLNVSVWGCALLFSVASLCADQLYELPAYEQVSSRGFSKRPLTVLVYMAADNDLHPFVDGDIRQMERIGSTENMNILVYLNTRYPRQAKVTRKLIVGKGKTMQFGKDEARDSGDPNTLIDALAWAHKVFPSDQFMLILWDHGTGALNRLLGSHGCDACRPCSRPDQDGLDQEGRAVCFDFSTGNYFTDAKLRYALNTVCRDHRKGKKIDVIAFDACLMASIEIGYVLQPYADYMVASQETVPGTGYGYHLALEAPGRQVLSSRDLARAVVYGYEKTYQGRVHDYTMSAIDLAQLPPLVSELDKLSKQLVGKLSGAQGKTIREAIGWAATSKTSSSFHERTYLDLDEWCTNLGARLQTTSPGAETAPLLQMINGVRAQIKGCTVANVHGAYHPHVAGTSIYFPRNAIDRTYPGLIWSQGTSWCQLLQAYKGR